uniref:Superoxide dismutase n=2 Tax=Paenibacillus athensensis TaxID=1967502 RepID=A0A4Y8PPE6_9BACL
MPAEAVTAPDSPDASPAAYHSLPPLSYAYDALEPFLDEATLRLHHDVLHRSVVEALNHALHQLAEAQRTSSMALILQRERECAAYSAEHALHSLLWHTLRPGRASLSGGPLAQELGRTFGGFEQFQQQFTARVNQLKNGGWALLIWNAHRRRLEIVHTAQLSPDWGAVPLLPLDLSEHAYYLKYGPDRAPYIEAWWRFVDWPYVSRRFEAARKLQWPAL